MYQDFSVAIQSPGCVASLIYVPVLPVTLHVDGWMMDICSVRRYNHSCVSHDFLIFPLQQKIAQHFQSETTLLDV